MKLIATRMILKRQMKSDYAPVRSVRWPLMYFFVVELFYELSLSSRLYESLALVWGLVLVGFTMAAMICAPLQWYSAAWLGYTPGDTEAFVPRFIAMQATILLNTVILIVIAYRSRRT